MEYIIIGLLVVIALSEVTRLVLTHKKATKKSHFKNKLQGTRKMRYDMEFKLFKTQEIREELRKEFDFMGSRVAAIEDNIKNFKGPKDEKAGIEDKLEIAKRDYDRLKGQMQNLDIEMFGAKPSAERPDGHIGIKEQIESMLELEDMLEEWIQKI